MTDRRDRKWRVGELARTAGLTVRTLHHYDEIGLLTPSDRTPAGYRLYSSHDVRRLYRVVALRRLGLRLDETSHALEGNGAELSDIVARQLQTVDRQLGDGAGAA